MSTEPVGQSPADASPAAPPPPPSAAPAEAVSPWAAPGSAGRVTGPFADLPAGHAGPEYATPSYAPPSYAPPAGVAAGDVLGAGRPPAGVPAWGAAWTPAAVPARRRRPRPVLLLSSALVLGTLLGGIVGYGIQERRRPTPLPPLQVALPAYPAAAADPKAVADAAPKPLAVDGDLVKLVIARPEGTEAWGDNPDSPSWLTVGELADWSGASKTTFTSLNQRGFRRAAGVDWKKGDTKYRVTLLQFGPDSAAGAIAEATDGGSTSSFADGVNGGYRVASTPSTWADSTNKYYYGYAVARRGTLVMKIEIFAPQKADAAELKDLAEKQWERLA